MKYRIIASLLLLVVLAIAYVVMNDASPSSPTPAPSDSGLRLN